MTKRLLLRCISPLAAACLMAGISCSNDSKAAPAKAEVTPRSRGL